jgi:polysaccharide biosynthesis/export protein
MRATCCLMPMLAVAFALAGCAQAPNGRGLFEGGAAAPPPPATPGFSAIAAAPQPAAPQPQGIDNVLYGTTAGLYGSTVTPWRPAPAPQAALGYAATGEGPYTLDSGDRLRIVVFGQDGLTNSYAVDASGHIDMPLIGSVLARGATSDELAGRIGAKLRQGFVREPHVAVEIEAYRPFFILGEVTQPGQYPYVANMSVETAVAIAGGFTPRAFRKTVTLSRVVNGQQQRMTVPVTSPLRPGDTVNVQERWF